MTTRGLLAQAQAQVTAGPRRYHKGPQRRKPVERPYVRQDEHMAGPEAQQGRQDEECNMLEGTPGRPDPQEGTQGAGPGPSDGTHPEETQALQGAQREGLEDTPVEVPAVELPCERPRDPFGHGPCLKGTHQEPEVRQADSRGEELDRGVVRQWQGGRAEDALAARLDAAKGVACADPMLAGEASRGVQQEVCQRAHLRGRAAMEAARLEEVRSVAGQVPVPLQVL